MYEPYWNLTSRPFSHRADLSRVYSGHSWQSGSLRLRFAVENQCGPIALVGVSGVGKSTLLRHFAEQGAGRRPLVNMVFPRLSAPEMLRMITLDIATDLVVADVDRCSPDIMLQVISNAIGQWNLDGGVPLIHFDDAHLLAPEALQAAVQPLLNLVDRMPELRFSVVLSGQPVLLSNLARQPQLNERVGMIATLDGWTLNETRDFIATSVAAAGGSPSLFTPDAVERLFELSGGNPRRVIRLADMALLVGFAEQLASVTTVEIESLSHELLSGNAA